MAMGITIDATIPMTSAVVRPYFAHGMRQSTYDSILVSPISTNRGSLPVDVNK
jgi:hypothetical protein